ncbi:hypothetical protein D3C79_708530 [compost metagenome]
MSVGAVELRQYGETRRPHHLQQDVERPLAAALIIEQLVLAEHQGADAIEHPAQLEVGEGSLNGFGGQQAVFQQQNIPAFDRRHVRGAPDPRQGIEVAPHQPAPHLARPHRDQPVGPARLGPGLVLPIEPLLAPVGWRRQRVGHLCGSGHTDLVKTGQGLIHQGRQLAERGHQRRPVEGDQPGSGVNTEQQRRHVRVADEDLGIFFKRLVIEIRQQGVGVAAADDRHDGAHLRIADKRIELGGPRGDGAGAPVILGAGQAARLELEALRRQIGPGALETMRRPGGGRAGGREKTYGVAGFEPGGLEQRHG